MRIVYCIAGTYRGGGMERVLAIKANWLVEHGYEVTILTTDQEGRVPFFKLDSRINSIDLGIGYEKNNGGSFLNKLVHYPMKQFMHRRKLKRVLDKIDPDVVVSMFCNEAAFVSKIHERSKKVLEIHFSRFKRMQYGRKGLYGLADRIRSKTDVATADSYDRFIVLTNEDRSYWGDMSNIRVIPNPSNSNIDRPSGTEGNKTALAIGRLSYQKSFDRLIDAWAIVARVHPDWNLKIVGDGEMYANLKKRIENYGLSDCIELIGPTKNVEVLYQESSMYLMTSRYEGLPMVLIEAQSFGLPIVSFACKCGPKDVVSDGVDGFLTEEGDIDAFASRICTLIEDEELRKRMSREALRASKRYELDTIMGKWDTLFKELKDER